MAGLDKVSFLKEAIEDWIEVMESKQSHDPSRLIEVAA